MERKNEKKKFNNDNNVVVCFLLQIQDKTKIHLETISYHPTLNFFFLSVSFIFFLFSRTEKKYQFLTLVKKIHKIFLPSMKTGNSKKKKEVAAVNQVKFSILLYFCGQPRLIKKFATTASFVK